jgi:hypothetical protein
MLVEKNPDISFSVEQAFPDFVSNPSRPGQVVALSVPEEFREFIKQLEAAKKN